ncbi:MAG TPA: YicC/YloC family endoribonuclease, partial [Minicystis sp.]|nr:YicC/YloC family endoribonuclease [Minicystis sp.]
MTGFGVGDAPLGGGRVAAEVRSVNQRFLDVRVRVPRDLADLAGFAEHVVRERLRRGRIELVLHTEGPVSTPLVLDKARARAAFDALVELRDELAPRAELPLSLLGAVPDLFVGAPSAAAPGPLRDAVRVAIERAVAALDAMAEREGAAIVAD